uniref:Uncharacterized protein n=1 Tax=Grammatophora oceanica TaxID=210454 RepID=A0A7S1UU47_9STRA|mmetsp:Transcript_23317/g.34565  ORF Transcript_23317/g.34565 Transcript_23317/m.34565 type:complete len:321 (+) Transcript_23317:174-1136(+)|eukprot:CAMPEP_0194036120 /NCGR_PEP_ID=MMETSP0009_2-20130614/8494_1 /TAXON_ID=210454 /ORGANISM="Grammatophora oceanica, Strain CCMP 410" /LENGTH=320 /DNA_ID=CAMNT_0038677735 /DNA_START=174 /DNA_END=1136 /DNA_ORIENTATION=-
MPHHLADASFTAHEFLEGPYARVPKEIGCAFTASLLVSPLVSIIDKAIVQEITGVGSLMKSMGVACKEMVVKPKIFFNGLSFKMTFLVYFGTYAVANLSEAALDYYQTRDEGTRKFYKVGSASAANIGLLAWRDSVFARAFAAPGGKPPSTTPMRTIALFAARDSATMAATFYFAPKCADYLVTEHDWDPELSEVSTALAVPVLSQFLTAPIHIHALDYYNRPVASMADRMSRISKELYAVCFARGLRVLPAFGIGSYSNNKFRELTIRQPNEELLLKTKITRRITQLQGVVKRRYTEKVVKVNRTMTEKVKKAKERGEI